MATRAAGPELTDPGARSIRTVRLLLGCGAVAGPLFVVAFLAEGAMRPGYDPVRVPVSSLALGTDGWMQVANFILTGALMLGYAQGLRRKESMLPTGSRWGPRLVAVLAVGLIGAGVFVTDPVNGYMPEPVPATSVHGGLHVLFSLFVFVPLAVAGVVFGRRFGRTNERGWAVYSVATGGLVAAGLAVFWAAGSGTALEPLTGLVQRLTIAVGWGWLSALALHLLSSMSRGRGSNGRGATSPARQQAGEP